jgi:small redox-active disulfide protein 2
MKKITILGTGCPKCKTLLANAEKAAKNKGIEYKVEKVQEIADIVAYGVMSTPGLAIDGKIVSSGRVLSPKEIEDLI